MFGKGPIFKHIETALKPSNDESLNAIPTVDLTHVDLFSELTPGKSADFRKENDLSREVKPEENSNLEMQENEVPTPMLENKVKDSSEISVSKKDFVTVSSGHTKTDTKTILKIVEFYSDNTYRVFFPE
jgi:hypothetical protein